MKIKGLLCRVFGHIWEPLPPLIIAALIGKYRVYCRTCGVRR